MSQQPMHLPHCIVRPWVMADATALVLHANDRDVWRNLRDRFPHPYTDADAKAWLDWVTRTEPATHFAIAVEGEATGGIGFTVLDDVHRRVAEIGYWIGRREWGRGLATEAVRAVSAYAFAHHGLVRLQACVFDWNPASMRVLEKAGYACEARLKQAVSKDGATTDMLIYAMLRP